MAAPWPSPRECLVPYPDVSAVTSSVGGINQPHPDSQTPSSPLPIPSFIHPYFPLIPSSKRYLVNIEMCWFNEAVAVNSDVLFGQR